MNGIELSFVGQLLVMAYTFIFSLNAFVCIGKYFHKRPLSNIYDVIQKRYSPAYTVLGTVFNFGFIVLIIGLFTSSLNTITLMICSLVLAVIICCLVLHLVVLLYIKISEIHQRLGMRK
ncbi:hypothetical protein [Salmonella phage SD-1_S14]|nr:hypothetical protein [Salmonella phage SD-1_S14]